MGTDWNDAKLGEYLKTLDFNAKLTLLYTSGYVGDRVGTLVKDLQDLADECSEDKNIPESFALTKGDQAKILQAATLLEEVQKDQIHRTGWIITALQEDYSTKGDHTNG